MLIQKKSRRSFLPITYLLTYLFTFLLTQRLQEYQESLSEISVAVQMQGGCVSAHAAVIATFQAPAICSDGLRLFVW